MRSAPVNSHTRLNGDVGVSGKIAGSPIAIQSAAPGSEAG